MKGYKIKVNSSIFLFNRHVFAEALTFDLCDTSGDIWRQKNFLYSLAAPVIQ